MTERIYVPCSPEEREVIRELAIRELRQASTLQISRLLYAVVRLVTTCDVLDAENAELKRVMEKEGA